MVEDIRLETKKENHFVSFAVVVPIAIGGVDVFTRKEYRDILLESLQFSQEKKDYYCMHGV
jgi:hypothetical protein